MPRKNVAAIVTVMLAVLACSGSAGAQSLTGQLSGTVVDTSDAVLPGVTVTLVNELSGDQRTTVSNDSGNFVFAAVPGRHLHGEGGAERLPDHRDQGHRPATGREPQPHRSSSWASAGLTEQVAVTAVTELAPMSSGEKSATITGEQIQNIAIVGRSAAELLEDPARHGAASRTQQRRAGIQRRGHRHQRQRRGRQAERARQLLGQRHAEQRARHHHRRRARARTRAATARPR